MIKFVKDHVTATCHYRAGAVVELSEEQEAALVEQGVAEVKSRKSSKNVRTKSDGTTNK